MFNKMLEQNVVSWTVMIQAYAKNGLVVEALNLFYQMQRTSSWPNNFTLSSVISACACFGILQHGKEVHEEINRNYR